MADNVYLLHFGVDDSTAAFRSEANALAYLDKWGWEVGRFVEGLTKTSTDAELAAAAPGMPVFALARVPATTVAA